MESVAVILLAGGKGVRMGEKIPKQFLPLAGKPIARHSFDLFQSLSYIEEIVVVAPRSHWDLFPASHALPGNTRQESLKNGFQALTSQTKQILIHDSARPFITQELVESVCLAAKEHGASACAEPVHLTIKQVDEQHFVTKTLNRSQLVAMQTPQVIRRDWLEEGLSKDIPVTDDVSLVESLGHPVKIVPGSEWNRKITTPTDLLFAKTLYDCAQLPS